MSTSTMPRSLELSQKTSRDGRLIILDWDDTIIPSSFLSSQGLSLSSQTIPKHVMKALDCISDVASSLLKEAMLHGVVVIVTNAEAGWVQLSAQKFLPRLVPIIRRLKIVSARSTFEPLSKSPLDWKINAFKSELETAFAKGSGKEASIMSIGDSVTERAAVFHVAQGYSLWAKSVKLVERPTPEQLLRELQLISERLAYLASFQGDLDLMLTISLLMHGDGEQCDSPVSGEEDTDDTDMDVGP